MPLPTKKTNQAALKKWQLLGLGQGNYKTDVEHLLPENKEEPARNVGTRQKDKRVSLKGPSMLQFDHENK